MLRPSGSSLNRSEPYLMSIARRELPGNLRGKYDAADLVQETLLEAHRGLAGFTREPTPMASGSGCAGS